MYRVIPFYNWRARRLRRLVQKKPKSSANTYVFQKKLFQIPPLNCIAQFIIHIILYSISTSPMATTSTTPPSTTAHSRLVVVSNRLPVTIKKDESGWTFGMSSGGLVSALSGLKKEMTFSWIGWPGLEVAMEDRMYVRDSLMERYSCLPVFLSDEIADMHYNGFSNR